jgi:hypothetical protein
VHALGQNTLIAENIDPLMLLLQHVREAELDKRVCGQRLAELPTLDHGDVQVRMRSRGRYEA